MVLLHPNPALPCELRVSIHDLERGTSESHRSSITPRYGGNRNGCVSSKARVALSETSYALEEIGQLNDARQGRINMCLGLLFARHGLAAPGHVVRSPSALTALLAIATSDL